MAATLTTTINLQAVDAPVPQPPVAQKIPKIDLVHGDRRVDNYFWLREKSNPDVEGYLEAGTRTLTPS